MTVKQRLSLMKGAALFLLFLVTTMVMWTYVKQTMNSFELTFDALLLSSVFSFLSVFLGFGFYYLEKISLHAQRYLLIGLSCLLLFSSFISYGVFGLAALIDVLSFYLKLGLYLFLWGLPIIISYGIFKRIRLAIIGPTIGIIFLYFISRIFLSTVGSLMDTIWSSLLFFILYILFLECATSFLFYHKAFEKIVPQNQNNTFLLQRFNMVFSSYFLFLILALSLGLLFSGAVILLNEFFISINSTEFLNIRLGSHIGLYVFVGFTVLSVFLFWLVTPSKKREGSRRFWWFNKSSIK